MTAHHVLGPLGLAGADRLQQVAVLGDGVVEPGHAVESEEPDPEGEDVVLLERRLDERVVRAPVDVTVDALVELDQRPFVAGIADAGQLVQQRPCDRPVLGARALGGAAGGEALERETRLRQCPEVTDVDAARRRSRDADTP